MHMNSQILKKRWKESGVVENSQHRRRLRSRDKEAYSRNWRKAIWLVYREVGEDEEAGTGSIYTESAWCKET